MKPMLALSLLLVAFAAPAGAMWNADGVREEGTVPLDQVFPGEVIATGAFIPCGASQSECPASDPAGLQVVMPEQGVCDYGRRTFSVEIPKRSAFRLEAANEIQWQSGQCDLKVLQVIRNFNLDIVCEHADEATVTALYEHYGWGGSWDVLTSVESALTWTYGCGQVIGGAGEGACTWAAWNGWQLDSCTVDPTYTWQTSTQMAHAVTGVFHWDPWYAPRNYDHSLTSQAIGDGYGGGRCGFASSGKIVNGLSWSCVVT